MNTVELTKALIAYPSLTPDDAGCQTLIAELLTTAGFKCRHMPFGRVSNLWATHGENNTGPTLCLVGHTDVVPTGDLSNWNFPPFEAIEKDGLLYGRGAQDMKGSVAAFVIAASNFVKKHPGHKGRLALLITSDEEGPSIDGTAKVLEQLWAEGEKIDYCLVGEPSCEQVFGDTIKRGRRGSLSAHLIIKGIQGHVAYPEKALNPIHAALPCLETLCKTTWDEGHPHFPPTHLQISNIKAGTGANNVIPGNIEINFNIRYNPSSTLDSLKQKIINILNTADLKYEIIWQSTGGPFFTEDGELLTAVQCSISKILHIIPKSSTHGGTSDGRFFAPKGIDVVEFGPCNNSIHKVNEAVRISELEALEQVYLDVFEEIFSS